MLADNATRTAMEPMTRVAMTTDLPPALETPVNAVDRSRAMREHTTGVLTATVSHVGVINVMPVRLGLDLGTGSAESMS